MVATPAHSLSFLGTLIVSLLTSVTAEVLTFPLDTLKIKIQANTGGGKPIVSIGDTLAFVAKAYADEGFAGFFNGLEPALMRQATYGTMRFALYPLLQGVSQGVLVWVLLNLLGFALSEAQALLAATGGQAAIKILAGLTAGALASSICNPFDVVKTRMQAAVKAGLSTGAKRVSSNTKHASGKKHPRRRSHTPSSVAVRKRNSPPHMLSQNANTAYKHTLHGIYTIYQEEGLQDGLYRGVVPTVARASALAAAEMAGYDFLKSFVVLLAFETMELFASREDALAHPAVHFGASFLTSFIAAFVTNPFELVKTRIMSANANVTSKGGKKMPLPGMIQTFQKVVAKDGISVLWSGYWAGLTRMMPNNILLFVCYEQFATAVSGSGVGLFLK